MGSPSSRSRWQADRLPAHSRRRGRRTWIGSTRFREPKCEARRWPGGGARHAGGREFWTPSLIPNQGPFACSAAPDGSWCTAGAYRSGGSAPIGDAKRSSPDTTPSGTAACIVTRPTRFHIAGRRQAGRNSWEGTRSNRSRPQPPRTIRQRGGAIRKRPGQPEDLSASDSGLAQPVEVLGFAESSSNRRRPPVKSHRVQQPTALRAGIEADRGRGASKRILGRKVRLGGRSR